MSKELVTLTDINKFAERNKQLYDILTKARDQVTPKEYIKKRSDGFDYPDFVYMQDQMDTFFPLRSETLAQPIEIRADAQVVFCVLEVKDLVTGATRVGADAHRLTFKKDGKHTIESIVDIGNDIKSAIQEAQRNAYSKFGIAADVYKKQMRKPPTAGQQTRHDELMRSCVDFGNTIVDTDKKEKVISWWAKNEELWFVQTQQTADEFLDDVENKINSMKDKLNDKE